MELDDYAPYLMNLEQIIKRLHDKCLHKNYVGYMEDVGEAHDQLSRLMIWMLKQEIKK